MGADRGYAEAKRLLELHFGDEFKITSAYIDKALNWNSIPSENGEGDLAVVVEVGLRERGEETGGEEELEDEGSGLGGGKGPGNDGA
ncbi:uncharacterized protein LOC117545953 [Tachysurus ichikawai]